MKIREQVYLKDDGHGEGNGGCLLQDVGVDHSDPPRLGGAGGQGGRHQHHTSHWQPRNWVGRNIMSEKLELLVLAFASVLSTITFLELPAAH